MYSLTILDQKINVIDDLYSLNDLHKSSGGENKHKPSYFMSNQETKEFIQELDNQNINAYCIKQGSKGGTFVCRELVYRYAMWISPKFSLMVIRAFDALNTGAIPCLEAPKLSDEQCYQIQKAIKQKCLHNGVHYQTIYNALYDKFKKKSYKDILASDFEQAMAFIMGFEFAPALNIPLIQNILADNAHQNQKAHLAVDGMIGELKAMIDYADELRTRLSLQDRLIGALQTRFIG